MREDYRIEIGRAEKQEQIILEKCLPEADHDCGSRRVVAVLENPKMGNSTGSRSCGQLRYRGTHQKLVISKTCQEPMLSSRVQDELRSVDFALERLGSLQGP